MKIIISFLLLLFSFAANSQARVWSNSEFITPDSTLAAQIALLEKWVDETLIFMPTDSFYYETGIPPNTPISKLQHIAYANNKKWVKFKLGSILKLGMVTLYPLNDNLLFDFHIKKISTINIDASTYKTEAKLIGSPNTSINDTLNGQLVISKIFSVISLLFKRDFSNIKIQIATSGHQFFYSWDNTINIRERIVRAGGNAYHEWEICEGCYDPRINDSKLLSITTTDVISAKSDKITRLTFDEYEELAYKLLKDFASTISFKSKLTSFGVAKGPARLNIENAKGFITNNHNYWERIELKIDQLARKDEKTLVIRCSITGFYISVSTPEVRDGAFNRALDLEKDYAKQCQNKTQELIDYIKKEIKKL